MKNVRHQIPLSRPDITEVEIKYVNEVLRTPRLSRGPKVLQFEQMLAKYIGVNQAVTTNSGTTALHIILEAMGLGQDEEIITAPFSFIATANCILYQRAVPIFVDIEPKTLNIDVGRIEEKITKKTKAIIAADIFGYPANWEILQQLAQKHNLRLIEDSCEALGTQYRGRKCGTFAEAGAFGFYPNKQITTGEGGAVVTDNDNIAEQCRILRNQGRGDHDNWLNHSVLGYNYRLSDINCALGIGQLERIDEILAKREKAAIIYNSLLGKMSEIKTPFISQDVRRSWFVYVIILNDNYSAKQRDIIIEQMQVRGIECGGYFPPIHLQPFYRKMFGFKKGDFTVTESTSERTIALPFYTSLTQDDIKTVVASLREVLTRL